MLQLQVPLGYSLPISLVLLSHLGQGRIVFIKTGNFSCIIDLSPDPEEGSDDIGAIFDAIGFTIGDEEFSYGVAYDYKNIPVMLNWLKQQNLQWPNNIVFEA